MTKIGSTLKAVATQGIRTVAKAKILRDQSKADAEAKRLLGVISRVLHNDFTPKDQAWFAKVEERRGELLASKVELPKVDFGAGSGDMTRSVEEMKRGVVTVERVTDATRSTSKPPSWARLLYALIAEYQPHQALELGTAFGISAGYQGGAIGPGDSFVTIEGAPKIAEVARETIRTLGLEPVVDVLVGRFGDILPGYLASAPPLGYVFIDGHHDELATREYHEMLKEKLAPGAVLVYDDIHWSPGMERAWAAISADPALSVTVDMRTVGICILGGDTKRAYRYWFRGAEI